MKAKYLGLMGILLATVTVSAQTKTPAKTAYNGDRYNDYDRIHAVDGKKVEEIQMHRDGKVYKAELVNDKMTELYVDGEKIPQADWAKHASAVTAIRVQLELNREQAKANAIQAKKNDEQSRLNDEQAKRNAEQAVRNDIQAKKNDEQQARNAEQAKRNAEQDEVNRQQAKRNAEQAKVNDQQAKINAEQAAANERFMKEFTEDLVSDKIIPDANSLKDFSLNKTEMVVNGVKQPDSVYKKYSEKYSKQSNGFTYSRDGIIQNN
jgi:hypothetical protein